MTPFSTSEETTQGGTTKVDGDSLLSIFENIFSVLTIKKDRNIAQQRVDSLLELEKADKKFENQFPSLVIQDKERREAAQRDVERMEQALCKAQIAQKVGVQQFVEFLKPSKRDPNKEIKEDLEICHNKLEWLTKEHNSTFVLLKEMLRGQESQGKRIDALQSEMSKGNAISQVEVEPIKAELKHMQSNIQKITAGVNQPNGKVFTDEVQSIRLKLESLESKVDPVPLQVDQLLTRVGGLETDVMDSLKSLSEELDTVKTSQDNMATLIDNDFAIFKGTLSEHQTALAKSIEANNETSRLVNAANETILKLSEKIAEQENSLNRADGTISRLSDKMNEQENTVKAAIESLSRVVEELAKQQKSIANVMSFFPSIRQDIENLKDNPTRSSTFDQQQSDNNDAINSRIAPMEHTLMSHQQHLHALATGIRSLEHRYNNLTTEPLVNAMTRTMATCFPHVRNAEQAVVRLNQKVDALNQSVLSERTTHDLKELQSKISNLPDLTGIQKMVSGLSESICSLDRAQKENRASISDLARVHNNNIEVDEKNEHLMQDYVAKVEDRLAALRSHVDETAGSLQDKSEENLASMTSLFASVDTKVRELQKINRGGAALMSPSTVRSPDGDVGNANGSGKNAVSTVLAGIETWRDSFSPEAEAAHSTTKSSVPYQAITSPIAETSITSPGRLTRTLLINKKRKLADVECNEEEEEEEDDDDRIVTPHRRRGNTRES